MKQVVCDTGPLLQASDWIEAGLLHSGEAEALALAKQLPADWLLTDDTAARVLSSRILAEAREALLAIYS